MPHPGALFWLFLYFNRFLFQPGKFHSKCIIQIASVSTEWGIFHFHYFHFSFHNPLYACICPFLGLSFPLFFFILFIVLVLWMVHVHSIKFTFRIVLGALSPILDISGYLYIWFLDTPGFNIIESLNITLVGFP